jgi:predicted transcriptional regulator
MESTTMRVANKTHRTLKQLAHSTDRTMQQVLEEALELYRRQTLLKQADAAYARLKADPEAHQTWQRELAEWEALDDGLGDE